MILFSYTHWFWITILIVCTSGVPVKEAEDNGTVEQSASDTTKITPSPISTTPIMPPSSGGMVTAVENTTATSVMEPNMTTFNTLASGGDEEMPTTLETSFREDNESLSASTSDRAAVAAPGDATIESRLTAAGITGITLGCVVLVAVLCSVSYIWYRGRGFNRPQVLTDRSSNLDSSGYIDDTSDNSEEMYSLDNDSFLNSLEAMTIQNYWTDTVKHTKL